MLTSVANTPMPMASDLAMALDATLFAAACGLTQLDPYQRDLLTAQPRRALLSVTRQGGKSAVTAVAALHKAMYTPDCLVLLGSPSQDQSGRMLRTIKRMHGQLETAPKVINDSALRIEFDHGSQIRAMPGDSKTVRGYSAPALIVVDEAAFADDDYIKSLRPMQATNSESGAFWALSTPQGRRGWFFETFTGSDEGWTRIRVPASACPRIDKVWLAEQLKELGPTMYEQEFNLQFIDDNSAAFSTAIIDAAFVEFPPLW
jgi:hypothetical protein